MTDDLHAAVQALQGDDEALAQRTFAAIADVARRDPGECAAELSRAILAERARGTVRTPRLLTLLGMTRVPAPECLPVCLELLRAMASAETLAPADAALGAAAIVARTQPRALLPDVASVQADPQAARAVDQHLLHALILLLSITSEFLDALPHSAVTEMARWLWHDCVTLDLMTLTDFAGLQLEKSGSGDPLIALMVDLIERVPAAADEKRYAAERLRAAGVGDAATDQLQTAWRAICVAPATIAGGGRSPAVVDPEPPPPDPRADEWLAAFGEGDDTRIELARAAIDEMFEGTHPPAALAWWVAVTVDALPPRRRRADIDWALRSFAATVRRHGERITAVPPSVLLRWLDTPQLLHPSGTQIALGLLARQQPGLVVQRCLHRAVAASGELHPEMLVGGLWRALAEAEPSAVLQVASRWIACGFGPSAFLRLLFELLLERARAQPSLIDTLSEALTTAPDLPAGAIDAARTLLDEMRVPPEGPQA